METKKPIVEENTNKFSIPIAVLKVLGTSSLVLLSLMQASALFRDITLEALETSYKSATNTYNKNSALFAQYKDATESSYETRCSTYKALKAYKEAKGLATDPNLNPCTEVFTTSETQGPVKQ